MIKMLGFACIIVGTLVYNKVILQDVLRDQVFESDRSVSSLDS